MTAECPVIKETSVPPSPRMKLLGKVTAECSIIKETSVPSSLRMKGQCGKESGEKGARGRECYSTSSRHNMTFALAHELTGWFPSGDGTLTTSLHGIGRNLSGPTILEKILVVKGGS